MQDLKTPSEYICPDSQRMTLARLRAWRIPLDLDSAGELRRLGDEYGARAIEAACAKRVRKNARRRSESVSW